MNTYDKINLDEIRNIDIPLSIVKPKVKKKCIISAIITFCIVYYLINVQSMLLLLGITTVIYYLITKLYNMIFFYKYFDNVVDHPTIMIGYSNKILLLHGDEVLDIIEADEIKIRRPKFLEACSYFCFSTILEVKKEGIVVNHINVLNMRAYTDAILLPVAKRVSEDPIYEMIEVKEDNK